MTRVGVAYRDELRDTIFDAAEAIDCLEITVDQFIPFNRQRAQLLQELQSRFTTLPHGLNLSIGSVARAPRSYLDDVARVLEALEAPYHTDHLAISESDSMALGYFSPIWYTDEALDVVCHNVDAVQRTLGVPLLLEIVTRCFDIPGATMTEADFVARLCDATGCGVLLDITNIFINAHNHHDAESAGALLQAMPPGSARHFHVVGYGRGVNGKLVDSHAATIQPEIWGLLEDALARHKPDCIILERDANFPTRHELIAELSHARQLVSLVAA